jgi:hypothetical protein
MSNLTKSRTSCAKVEAGVARAGSSTRSVAGAAQASALLQVGDGVGLRSVISKMMRWLARGTPSSA